MALNPVASTDDSRLDSLSFTDTTNMAYSASAQQDLLTNLGGNDHDDSERHPGLHQSPFRCCGVVDRIVRRRGFALRYFARRVRSQARGPAVLDLFKRYGIKTTWGVTGHSMESFPRAGEMIIEDGHEIGIHGYTHENPLAMTREQESGSPGQDFRHHQAHERQSTRRLHGAVVGVEP